MSKRCILVAICFLAMLLVPYYIISAEQYNTSEKSWHFLPKKNAEIPSPPKDSNHIFTDFPCYYLGDTLKKDIYLTFDEGYENGYTDKILNTLKQKNIKAAFFVTEPYIKSQPALVKRMISEGHLVCNHSTNHPSMAKILDFNKFSYEIKTCEKTYKSLTGLDMPKFFRPPMGRYSDLSLFYTKELGYKTIFWSFAYVDWFPNKQPTEKYAKKIILERTHNGAIILLHAVSKTNSNILEYLIDAWQAQGYELKSLDNLK